MNRCWCRIVLAILVIVFAWWQVAWANWALTVIGILLLVQSCSGMCCCCGPKKEMVEPPPVESGE